MSHAACNAKLPEHGKLAIQFGDAAAKLSSAGHFCGSH
jgi:hypothetical protein